MSSFSVSLTFGLNRCMRPSDIPLSVTPRKKKMISTMYGNVAVTYTTCKRGKIIKLTPILVRLYIRCLYSVSKFEDHVTAEQTTENVARPRAFDCSLVACNVCVRLTLLKLRRNI